VKISIEYPLTSQFTGNGCLMGILQPLHNYLNRWFIFSLERTSHV